MREKFLLLACLLILTLVPVTVRANSGAGEFTPVTGFDMMERLGLGISFANTTEARAWPWVPGWDNFTETAWGQPPIRGWNFEAVALKGFDSYRMCITWTTRMLGGPLQMEARHTSLVGGERTIPGNVNRQAIVADWARNTDFTINPAFMDRIQQLVDYALDAGLYVIINTHHEEELYWLIQDNEFELAEELLNAIWTQVAERFADYSERLIFEIMNEPHLLRHYQGPGHWISRDGSRPCPELISMVNRLNISALNVIRNSGGNNAERVVIISTPGATVNTIPTLEIPNDPFIMVGTFGYYGDFVNNQTIRYIRDLVNRGIGFVNKEDAVGYAVGQGLGAHPTLPMHVHARQHLGMFADMGVPSFFFTGCLSTDANRPDALLNRVTGEWNNGQILQALFAAYGKTPGPDLELDLPDLFTTIYTRSDIRVTDRQNPWDGIDIAILPIGMDLARNDYRITITGRVQNTASNTVTTMALNGQDAPWFWLATDVTGNRAFTIEGNIGITFGVIDPGQFERGFRIQTIGDVLSNFLIEEITIERAN